MKFLKIIKEHTVKPYHKNMIRVMDKRGISDDTKEIWDFLTNTLSIDDVEGKLEIIHLYKKYYGVETEELEDMSDSDFSDFEDIDSYDAEHQAIAEFLDLPPLLIIEENYDHYGLNTYKDLVDGNVYAVGMDDDVYHAMRSYYEGWVDNMGGIEYIDRYLLEDFIELDSYRVESWAEDYAIDTVDYMDEDEVIEEAGYDPIDSYQEKLDELEIEIDDLKSDKEDLEIELGDLDDEDMDEMEELQESIDDLEYRISEKESEYEDIESEMNSLYDTAKEELVATKTEENVDMVESEGYEYFIQQGWSFEDVIDSFYIFDESGLEEYLADNEDRGESLASYDGVEEQEGDFYIYRID